MLNLEDESVQGIKRDASLELALKLGINMSSSSFSTHKEVGD